MKLLAIESATLSGGAALLDGDRLLGDITLNIAVIPYDDIPALELGNAELRWQE